MEFKKATRKNRKLKLFLQGPSGTGKTYSSLLIAKGIGGKVAVIDTENGSAELYSNLLDFDVLHLDPPYTPERYIEAIKKAVEQSYDILIIDSVSHEWNKTGGCLDIYEKAGGKFSNWKEVTPKHNRFLDTIVQAPIHIIATARTKSDFVAEDVDGKTRFRKVGLKPIQKDEIEYEFDVDLALNHDHIYTIFKDRTHSLEDHQMITQALGEHLIEWCQQGKSIEEEIKELEDKMASLTDLHELQGLWRNLHPTFKANPQIVSLKDKYKQHLTQEGK